jgi:hypothetical protein
LGKAAWARVKIEGTSAILLGDGLGYLKIAMSPGMVGIVVANQISSAIASLGAIEGLMICLRRKHWWWNRHP